MLSFKFLFFLFLSSTVIHAYRVPADIRIRSGEQRQNDGDSLAYSPPVYPSPWMDPKADGWQDAYAKAYQFVSQLTLLEKVNLTTGVG